MNEFKTNINVYRFKFSNQFMNELLIFSKINQHAERKLYNEKWNEWISEKKDIINIEIQRLEKLGYTGNILNKMFKSSRYYFRKKILNKNQVKKRQKYNLLDKNLLYKMDMHILHNIKENNYTPAKGFNSFCLENTDFIKNEIIRLLKEQNISSENISYKIRKTYKNRYFNISRDKIIYDNKNSENKNQNENEKYYNNENIELQDIQIRLNSLNL